MRQDGKAEKEAKQLTKKKPSDSKGENDGIKLIDLEFCLKKKISGFSGQYKRGKKEEKKDKHPEHHSENKDEQRDTGDNKDPADNDNKDPQKPPKKKRKVPGEGSVTITGDVEVGVGFFLDASMSIEFRWTWKSNWKTLACEAVGSAFGFWGAIIGAFACPLATAENKIYLKVCH